MLPSKNDEFKISFHVLNKENVTLIFSSFHNLETVFKILNLTLLKLFLNF